MKNHIIGIAVLGMLLSIFSIQSSYADRITHVLSGKCVHPLGRPESPGNNTRLVLNGDDCKAIDDRLNFSIKNGYIVHSSGKCVYPLGRRDNPSNNTELVLYSNCDAARAKFTVLSGGQIQHVSSGKCIHPKGGWSVPGNDTRLVLYDECHGDRIKFSVSSSPNANKAFQKKTKLHHLYSGRCVHPKGRPNHPGNNTDLVFHEQDCEFADSRLYFTMLPNGAIQHSSGKCIHPYGGWGNPGNNTSLVLYDGCGRRSVQFEKLPNGAIQHKSSGKCITPYGGKLVPDNDTKLVLYEKCDGDKLRLGFH